MKEDGVEYVALTQPRTTELVRCFARRDTARLARRADAALDVYAYGAAVPARRVTFSTTPLAMSAALRQRLLALVQAQDAQPPAPRTRAAAERDLVAAVLELGTLFGGLLDILPTRVQEEVRTGDGGRGASALGGGISSATSSTATSGPSTPRLPTLAPPSRSRFGSLRGLLGLASVATGGGGGSGTSTGNSTSGTGGGSSSTPGSPVPGAPEPRAGVSHEPVVLLCSRALALVPCRPRTPSSRAPTSSARPPSSRATTAPASAPSVAPNLPAAPSSCKSSLTSFVTSLLPTLLRRNQRNNKGSNHQHHQQQPQLQRKRNR